MVRESPSTARPRTDRWLGCIVDGRYEILRVLGRGGMGTVYEARQLSLGRNVAVKLLAAELAGDAHHLRAFLREARAASAIDHPNVIGILDFGSQPSAYLVMEQLHGDDLGAMLVRSGALTWAQARPILVQVARGLAAAHRCGVIHRDIKPSNVFVLAQPADDGTPVVKVLDFGVAKVEHPTLATSTETRAIVGTVHYMAPEQAAGRKVDARVDVYSVGVLAYRMLAGALPFEADNPFAVLEAQLLRRPQPLSERVADMPAALDVALARALAPDPRDRFADMDALEAAFAAIPASHTRVGAAATRERPVREPTLTHGRAAPVARLEPTARLGPNPQEVAWPPAATDRLPAPAPTMLVPAPIEAPRAPARAQAIAPQRGPTPTGPAAVARGSSPAIRDASIAAATAIATLIAIVALVWAFWPGRGERPAVRAAAVVHDEAPPQLPVVELVPARVPIDTSLPPPLALGPTPSDGTALADVRAPDPIAIATPVEATPTTSTTTSSSGARARTAASRKRVDAPTPGRRAAPPSGDAASLQALARSATKRCAEQAAAGARVHVRFTIRSDGRPTLVAADAPHDHDGVGGCVENATTSWRFAPGSLRAGDVTVRF